MKEFRLLRADEIDVRIAQCGSWGCQLLLYKDARVDMALLDETVGPENWQRKHEVINGNLFCSVGIRVVREDGIAEWIWRQDVGTESNTEHSKGESSDSFKRTCTNFGIGRELYSAPTIFVKAEDLKTLKDNGNGRWTCKDYFTVNDIQYTDRKITYVQIRNEKTGVLLDYGKKRIEESTEEVAPAAGPKFVTIPKNDGNVDDAEPAMFSPEWMEIHGRERITEREIENLKKACAENDRGLTLDKALMAARRKSVSNLTYVQYVALVSQLGVAA